MKKILFLIALLVPSLVTAQTMQSTKFISASPTVDTGGAYASGDLIGGKLTFTNALRPTAGSGYLVSVAIADKAAQAVDLDLVLFRQDPTGTTFTDQAAFDPADADLGKVITVVNFGSSSRFAYNDNGTKFVGSLAIPLQGLTSANLTQGTIYGALVARGAYTGASSSDLTVTLGVSQD